MGGWEWFAKFLGLDALLALRIRIRECLDEQLCELPIATSPLNLGLAKRDGVELRERLQYMREYNWGERERERVCVCVCGYEKVVKVYMLAA